MRYKMHCRRLLPANQNYIGMQRTSEYQHQDVSIFPWKVRALKMQDLKMQDVKLADYTKLHEIAGHEIEK